MLALLQRVLSAEVEVDNQIIAKIDRGILVFLGIEKYDTEEQVDKIIKKIVNYRIFPDSDDKMNLSLLDSNLELLLVLQFTLALDKASNYNIKIQSGKFQADMQVKLINNGPATFMLSC